MEAMERTCPQCSHKNPLDAEFCGECGHRLIPAASDPDVYVSSDETLLEETDDVPAPNPPDGLKPKHIIYALVGLFLVIGTVWGIIKIWPGSGSEDGPQQGEVRSTPVNPTSDNPVKLKLATYWRSDLPILADNVAQMAKDINAASGGRLEIQVFFAGDATDANGNKIDARDLFDAVSKNKVQIIHSAAYYWENRIKGASFFSSVPFGMNHDQMESWIKDGEGLKLWRELYDPYNVIPFPCGHTGPQMGGWFNKEIVTVKDFRGITMRIPGLGGRVLEREGVKTVSLPPQDIRAAGQSGKIDAAEWIGAYHDYLLNLFEEWKYYYGPGWQEFDTMFEFVMNKDEFNKLPPDLQKLIESKIEEYNGKITRQFISKNVEYEAVLRKKNVQFKRFPTPVLTRLQADTDEVLKEYDGGNTKKIYDSYKQYQQLTSKRTQF